MTRINTFFRNASELREELLERAELEELRDLDATIDEAKTRAAIRKVFGSTKPESKLGVKKFSAYLSKLKGVDMTDEERELVAETIQRITANTDLEVWARDKEGNLKPVTVGTMERSTKDGRRFRIREVGRTGHKLSTGLRLPELVASG